MLKVVPVNFAHVRADFPVLRGLNRGKPLIFLDSAASAQKPQQVIEAISRFYTQDYANIHRGIYELSGRATKLYEDSRNMVRHFINAPRAEEVIFVRGTTEAINLVAQSYGRSHFKAGDEVILSTMEHHANIVPWYLLAQEMDIVIKVVPVLDDGSLDMAAYRNLFTDRTQFVSLTHVSNVLGTINPASEMVAIAHEYGVPIMLDGAQAAPHIPVDVTELDCDFYTFSGHKAYGPTGAGILYAKKALLEAMPPYQGGGDMINTVSFEEITFAPLPNKFEAGTPDIAAAVGLGAAIDYLQAVGMQNIVDHEQALLSYAEKQLLALPGLRILGTAKPKVGVISLVIDNIHPHDLGTVLDSEGVAIRAGHHCAMPLMARFAVPATVRVSLGIYNNEQDIDALVATLKLALRLFQ